MADPKNHPRQLARILRRLHRDPDFAPVVLATLEAFEAFGRRNPDELRSAVLSELAVKAPWCIDRWRLAR